MADLVNRPEAVRELVEYAKQFPHYQALLTEYNIFSLLRAPYKALSQVQRDVLADFDPYSDAFENSSLAAHSPYAFSGGAVTRLQFLIARAKRMDPLAVTSTLLSELVEINLDSDYLVADEDLEAIGLCRNLVSVDLSNTGIGDVGLRYLSILPELKFLNVDNTHISDAGIVQHLGNFETLELLSLGGFLITDYGVLHMPRLRRLKLLRIDCPRVSNSVIQRLTRHWYWCDVVNLSVRRQKWLELGPEDTGRQPS